MSSYFLTQPEHDGVIRLLHSELPNPNTGSIPCLIWTAVWGCLLDCWLLVLVSVSSVSLNIQDRFLEGMSSCFCLEKVKDISFFWKMFHLPLVDLFWGVSRVLCFHKSNQKLLHCASCYWEMKLHPAVCELVLAWGMGVGKVLPDLTHTFLTHPSFVACDTSLSVCPVTLQLHSSLFPVCFKLFLFSPSVSEEDYVSHFKIILLINS